MNKELDYIGCGKCGKTVRTLIDENYSKDLPDGWEVKIIPVKNEPGNPIRYVVCDSH